MPYAYYCHYIGHSIGYYIGNYIGHYIYIYNIYILYIHYIYNKMFGFHFSVILLHRFACYFIAQVCMTVNRDTLYNRSVCTDLVAAKFNKTSKVEDDVSSETSRWLFYQTIAFVIPSVTVTLIMGVYTDKKGHRLSLIMPYLGQAAGKSSLRVFDRIMRYMTSNCSLFVLREVFTSIMTFC